MRITASQYRDNFTTDFNSWTRRTVTIRDPQGHTLGHGVVIGLLLKAHVNVDIDNRSRAEIDPRAYYDFASGGPVVGGELRWSEEHSIELH